MDLPSDKYFISVKTQEDFYYFLSTGLMWELEPNAPSTWAGHLELVDLKKKRDYCDSVKADNYKASCRLEGFDDTN